MAQLALRNNSCDGASSIDSIHSHSPARSGTDSLLNLDQIHSAALTQTQRLSELVLRSVAHADTDELAALLAQTKHEWNALLSWLDASGMALYLADHLAQRGLLDQLPRNVATRMEQNLAQNAERTSGMIVESASIQSALESAEIAYAVMKGLSLAPASTPRSELRHQFDLDYLIAETSAPRARAILEAQGYRLYAASGQTWEFKKGESAFVTARDLYRDLPYRGVEFHLEPTVSQRRSRLARSVMRELCGVHTRTLCEADTFVAQAMHILKDLCGSFLRASHLLEFYRHTVALRGDESFWRELRSDVENDAQVCLALGVSIALLSHVLGAFAPHSLTQWTSDRLPPTILLWVRRYGRHPFLLMPPGTKLSVLLKQVLAVQMRESYAPASKAMPVLRLPPPVIVPLRNETFAMRWARRRIQMRFVLSRARFHLVEGLRLMIEARRWRRLLRELP